jgi:replication factor A1
MKKYDIREFSREGRQGKVASFLAGDDTGITRVTLWNEQADKLNTIEEGMVVQVKDAGVKDNQGRLELHLGMAGDIILEPKGVTVNVNPSASERSYAPRKISELSQADEFVDILGTIVQIFDPRTYTKRDGTQGTVANAIIDDGSGTIRASFWDQDARMLLGEAVDKQELLADAKLELLGQIVKVHGRAKLNPAYNTIELTTHKLVKNPDPQAEMGRLG